MTKSHVPTFTTLFACLLATACGSSSPSGFGSGGSADGGLGAVRDGTVVTRGPDGSVIIGSPPPGKDASSGQGATKDASTQGPGKDASGVTTPGPDGSTKLLPDAGTVTPTGDAAPPPPVTPCDLCVAAGGQCVSSVCTLTETVGNVPATTRSALQAGGSSDPALAWLYPYDNTVFPRGILSPTLQFAGTAPDATWVHITFPEMTYDGYFGPSTAPLGGGQVALSSAAWVALTAMASASDSVQVSLTKISGGKVSGTITESWTIAQGEARGTIYYETYDSQILGGIGSVGIMKIQPGATVPTAVKSGCGNVCHTASSDGSTLVANTVLAFGSASYDLKTNASTIFNAGGEAFTYGGLYPDGTFEMSATNYRTWLGAPSRLYNTKTGANIAAPGWDGTITNAGTAAFSTDGTRIAFNHEDKDNGAGHTLSVMSFALATHSFSNLVDIANDPAHTLAWPAWTPDNASIVYHAGSNTAFETDDTSDAGVGTTGDVFLVDVASQKSTRLDALDGYTPSGTTYLPANDPDLSFAPTVLPEAVGGYFWVVFTSHRSYGNTSPSKDNSGVNGKLWVAAVDIGGTPGQDSSHPAFFLQGQELTSDNLRGFWVLDPCQAAGSACTGGDQCCQGYCRPVSGQYECVGQPAQGCSNDMERCATSSNCCDSTAQCINHLCATVAPK
jgi:hypothetical protein